MAEYDFQIFCRGVDASDESFLDRLFEAGCDDATVFYKDGYLCLDFAREAASAEDAVISAVKAIERAGIGASVENIGPDDLASLAEIANRVGVTRASLQKYARGDSKVGADFPLPVANISKARRELYSAAEVMVWLQSKRRVELPEPVIDLVTVIDKANQALLVRQAANDDGVGRLLARLSASEPAVGAYA